MRDRGAGRVPDRGSSGFLKRCGLGAIRSSAEIAVIPRWLLSAVACSALPDPGIPIKRTTAQAPCACETNASHEITNRC